ncbi:SUKH-4 family immunity protein [Streptomyces sp. NPDC059567]|uniref:SUKH-4 family immunity protein n=1 Tax=Streptomyces sp. NPDC059567 TaxID=3346867 RepID=UPI0036CC47D2
MTGTPLLVPERTLHPAITHEATRRRLTEEGLPDSGRVLGFARLAESRVVTVSHLVEEGDDPGDLDPYIAGLVAFGEVVADEWSSLEVVLDGASGRVFSLRMSSARHAEVHPLAPSLSALARFLTAVDELTGLRGRFAGLAGSTSAEAVGEATGSLLSVFTEEEWGDGGWGTAGDPAEWDHAVPALWRITALIRPLPLVSGPGGGLRLDLPADLLDEEFGPGEVVRVDPANLPTALEHEPTRRFLTEVGLPKDGLMFGLADEDTLLLPLPEDRARAKQDPRLRHLWNGTDALPPDADRLFVVGGLMHDFDVVVDGSTGEVHYLTYDGDTVTPVNADLSTLAFTVWMHSRQQGFADEQDLTGTFGDFYHPLAAAMVAALASVDPIACLPAKDDDDYRYWPEVFHDEPGGVL